VSSEWHPDDSLHERDDKDELKGVGRVKAALRKHGVSFGNRVITSRDKGMDAVQSDLKRTGMPPGVEQWQIPIALGKGEDILCFAGRMEPGATVPEHAHKQAIFRVVVDGSLEYDGMTLKAGDWMLVPAGRAYGLTAGPNGCTTMYHHLPWPWPWWPW